MGLPLREGTRVPPSAAVVTIALIVANVLVLLFLEPSAMQRRVDLDHRSEERAVATYAARWGAVPCELGMGEPVTDANAHECTGEAPDKAARLDPDKSVLLSLLTSLFVHAGLLHLVENMIFLAVFGPAVERRLGSAAFALLYVGAGIIGTATHAALNLENAVPMVGASGAIAGVMGAYLVLWPRGRILTVGGGLALQLVWVPAWVLLGLFVVSQLLLPDASGIAWLAHIGGIAAGALAVLPLRMRVLERIGLRPA